MSNRKRRVNDGTAPCNNEQDGWRERPPQSSEIKAEIHQKVEEIFGFIEKRANQSTFDTVEKTIRTLVFTLGRLFLAYFLAWRHEHSREEVERARKDGDFRERLPQPKLIGTCFGKVRFWRTYLRGPGGSGIYPLDMALGITADGFSLFVMSMAAKLSTKIPYDQVAALLLDFFTWAPSKMSIEKAVLGLGKFTEEWFEKAPPPKGDGEVLIIQVDSKATPTATQSELEKRRGKRTQHPKAPSPRHRGRQRRKRRGPKARRKKGDKSKNGKAANLVVIYTLKKGKDKDGKPILLGPLNRKVYASYASKRHAFIVARREANKRGFYKGSGKQIQIVSDGDEDFERYSYEFFPGAIYTLDVMHVMEKLWEAGGCLYREGSPELTVWVKKMEKLIYRGKALKVVGEIAAAAEEIPRKGPGNMTRRKRLEEIRDYLFNRIDRMNYDWLRAEDLELASGSVEGAVKHVIKKRLDYGSMRWIKERAGALLQLRCIEVNGDWEAFIAFVQEKVRKAAKDDHRVIRILTWEPAPILDLALSA
jgi:hypothetical protein